METEQGQDKGQREQPGESMNASGSRAHMAAFWKQFHGGCEGHITLKRLHVWVRLPALVGRATPHFLHVFLFTGEKDRGRACTF